MAKKRKPAYFNVLEGMNCCYAREERECSDCPYDKYNDRDFYGMGTAYCMEKLNADAKKLADSLIVFCFCKDCICYKAEPDPRTWEPSDHGHCSTWNCDVVENEFCARGAAKYE